MSNDDDASERRGREGGVDDAEIGRASSSSSNGTVSLTTSNVHLIQKRFDDDVDVVDVDDTDARGEGGGRRVSKERATSSSSSWDLRREGTTASLWAAMRLRDDKIHDKDDLQTERWSDVDLYATKRALYRSRVECSRAIARGALLRWKLACVPRVSAARVADAAVRARERRATQSAFDRWCAQTPGISRRRRRRRRGGARARHGGGISFGGDDDDDGPMTPVDFLNDEEFPTDYRDELEIRLKQIARLEDALREANAREARAASGEAFEVEMRKFRSHLTNIQRELENVKRERDAYKKKWTESGGPAALKSVEERRANQRTMATQTMFDADADADGPGAEKARAEEKAAAIANAVPATKSEIRAAEKKWVDQARLFQQKFERQMEITSEFERKLREERTRLLRSETRYEARIQEMAKKHAEEIIEMRSRAVGVKEEEEDARSTGDAEDGLTYASPASLDDDRFAEYAKIGAARGVGDDRDDDVYDSDRSLPTSPAEEERFSTPAGGDASLRAPTAAASERPERFETASKRLHFASLDDFSSSSEDEYKGGDVDQDLNRRAVPSPPPPPVSAGATRKPIRLTVAVAKLVMMGHSQRDAIDALKRVDGNNVQAADAWLKTRA